jgi:hypothetical protein
MVRIAEEAGVPTGEVDQRRAEALGKRGGRALGELPFGGGPAGDHNPGRRRLQGAELRLVEDDGHEAMFEGAFDCSQVLGRGSLRLAV